MSFVTTKDGTNLYVRDWGHGRPVVLIHGWPLNGDSWEYQSVKLAEVGYRVIAYDRRGFGRSDQPYGGYDYDTLSDDLAAVIEALALEDAALVGFSMGGGEVARYMSRHHGRNVGQVALIASIVPSVLARGRDFGANESDIEGIKEGLRKDRPEFLRQFFKNFYGNGLFSGVSQGMLDWTLMMAMQASPKATLDCVDAFGKTDLRPDCAAIKVPTLIVHGTSDQTVPIDATAREAARMIAKAKLIEYDGAPHGLTATHADRLVEDLEVFLRR